MVFVPKACFSENPVDDSIIRKGKERDLGGRPSVGGVCVIVSTIIWLLVGFLAIGLAVALIVAVIAFMVTRMGDDRDWRD